MGYHLLRNLIIKTKVRKIIIFWSKLVWLALLLFVVLLAFLYCRKLNREEWILRLVLLYKTIIKIIQIIKMLIGDQNNKYNNNKQPNKIAMINQY